MEFDAKRNVGDIVRRDGQAGCDVCVGGKVGVPNRKMF